jgi:ADP-ribosylglycohydrolase
MSCDRGAFAGVILGTAVGDALGLPAEGLSPARLWKRWHGVWRQRLLLGRGMLSDDTEHAVPVALFAWLRRNLFFLAVVRGQGVGRLLAR